MLPGPVLIYQCATCLGIFRYRTIASGNNFGARYWTDGEIKAPMLPNKPQLLGCPHCATPSWLKDLNAVDEYMTWFPPNFTDDPVETIKEDLDRQLRKQKREKYENLPELRTLKEQEYWDYLNSNKLSVEEEVYLRKLAWRLANDKRRDGENIRISSDENLNMRRLLKLMRGAESSLLKAEIYRELGEFYESEIELNKIEFNEQKELIAYIKQLSNDKKCLVQEIKKEGLREN